MNEFEKTPAQWLRGLLYIQFAGFTLGLIDYLLLNDSWISWAQRLLDAGSIYCMFQLVAAHVRYRKAAILHTVVLVLELLGAALSVLWIRQMQSMSAILESTVYSASSWGLGAVIMMVVSWFVVWQLYCAHGDLVPEMAKKWRTLFLWSALAAVILSVGSAIQAALVVNGQISVELSSTIYILLQVPGKLVSVISMVYLWRTAQRIRDKEQKTERAEILPPDTE